MPPVPGFPIVHLILCAMANGWVVARSALTYLAVAAIALLINLGWKTRQYMDFITRISVTGKGRGLSLFWEKFRPTLPAFGLNGRRHLGFRSLLKSEFFRCRVNRYSNSVSTFQLTRLLISWDIHFNPGPLANKPSCQICRRTIARNHRSLCETCVGSNITSNAEKLPLSSLWRFQEITFRLGNAWLAYNNLSLITVWMWTHCRHFPSLLCRMNRFRIYTIYKATIMTKPQTKRRSLGSAGFEERGI